MGAEGEGGVQGYPQALPHREARRFARRSTAKYLRSISEDCAFVARARATLAPQWPLLANLRAGAWYASPDSLEGTCYFKSMDGHRNEWDFSLIRLNLNVARLAAGLGVVLVDCTGNRRKRFPDSMSKTVPIWCAVLQAVVENAEEGFEDLLHLPKDAQEERSAILERMPEWVRKLREALLPAKVTALAGALGGRRLRACWACPTDDLEELTAELRSLEDYALVLCISASKAEASASYIQGAGDDEEAWARPVGLSPQLFWQHAKDLVSLAQERPEQVDDQIRSLSDCQPEVDAKEVSFIGSTGLAVGNFPGAKPPEVWDAVDAVLNCGGEEHVAMRGDSRYLQLAAADEKKQDPSKSWWQEVLLPRALRFLWRHLRQGQRVLIHCTRGDNRAPAVAADLRVESWRPGGWRKQICGGAW
ncbi:unnamed protein product [Effrenium voratum]|uniref:Rit1 N-terminal domain-containing protein n=1 Tax=Effrenium voratum TaxID=2562239 RepID=A0AA36NBS6_9DINO|nr:unnamed protein product [Effrenium voratum]